MCKVYYWDNQPVLPRFSKFPLLTKLNDISLLLRKFNETGQLRKSDQDS